MVGVNSHRIVAHGVDITVWLTVVAALAIAFELALLRHRGERCDYKDVGRSVSAGLSWALIRIAGGKFLAFGTWLWAWRNLGLFSFNVRNPLSWLAFWVIGDFVYYITHRAEHRIRLLWSSHLVHHSSEEFNLATAVRQSWTEVIYKPAIALWAPLLGFHPTMYVVFGSVSLAVGQWQHVRWFPKVRMLDLVFASPSNHRVHHGTNPRYIDRNFGGSLVIWDRIFRTYQTEDEAAVYGLVHPPVMESALALSIGGYPELLRDLRSAPSLRSAMHILVSPPR